MDLAPAVIELKGFGSLAEKCDFCYEHNHAKVSLDELTPKQTATAAMLGALVIEPSVPLRTSGRHSSPNY